MIAAGGGRRKLPPEDRMVARHRAEFGDRIRAPHCPTCDELYGHRFFCPARQA